MVYADSAVSAVVLIVGTVRFCKQVLGTGSGAMIQNVLRPFAEGFRGSLLLWKGIILAPLSIVSVIMAFINAPRVSDFDITRRAP